MAFRWHCFLLPPAKNRPFPFLKSLSWRMATASMPCWTFEHYWNAAFLNSMMGYKSFESRISSRGRRGLKITLCRLNDLSYVRFHRTLLSHQYRPCINSFHERMFVEVPNTSSTIC
jgi:hypothetical protein